MSPSGRRWPPECPVAVTAGEITLAERRPERGARGGERLIALLVAVDVVDLLEVVEVAEHRGERQVRTGRLRDHANEVLAEAARVRQAGQRICGGANLGDGEVAEVREHRSGLADGLVYPALLRRAQRPLVGDEHRADHLAADE